MVRHLILMVAALVPATASAASFTLGAAINAGRIPFNQELSLGSSSGSPSVISGAWWTEAADHNFTISYIAGTNTATLTADWVTPIFNVPVTTSTTWQPVGVVISTNARIWTIASGGLAVTAANNPLANTAIRVQNLQITGPGIGVLTSPTLTASQTGAGATAAGNVAPITFTTQTGSGNWVLTGQVRFTGLWAITNLTGAAGSDLQFAFNALASDTPEPATLLMLGLGFAVLGVLQHRRTRRPAP